MRTIFAVSLLAACAGLGACDTRVDVGATSNASTQYSSVLVTIKEVWVNERATAAPDDGDWIKFPLAEPRTLELVDLDNAAMNDLATDLKVATGTYHQIRLFLVDRVEPLTEAARAAGATFNDQVTFVDANGAESTLPLELPDAAHGVGIETELVVPVPKDAVAARLAAASNTSSSTSGLSSGMLLGTTISGTTGTSTVVTTPTVPVPTVPGAMFPTVGVPTLANPVLPPGMIVPGVTTPGVTPTVPVVPGVTTPGVTPTVPVVPGVTMPGVTPTVPVVPGVTTPGVTPTVPVVPGVTTPGVTPTVPVVPGVTTPGVTPTVPFVPGTTTPTPTTSNGNANIPSTTVTVTSSVFFDAERDLAPFRFSDRLGFVLNPHLVAFDIDKVGNIQSQVDVASLALDPVTGRPDVEVTAERLDEELGRRVEIASAPLRADGTFTLYPLPFDGNAGDATTYDLVIHGPAVTTVVIRGVPATKGAPSSSSGVGLGAITLVASGTFFANVAADATVAPRGARIRFYQTLADDAAPFVIDERPADPLTGRLGADEPLSDAAVVVYGTFGSALIAAAPVEGAARYSVAAFAPLYGNGDLAATAVAPPAAPATVASFTVPAIAVPPPAGSGTITANVTAPTPGKYDSGALLVTHDGAIVTAAPLEPALQSAAPTAVSVEGVPATAGAEFDRGLYYLEAWAWSSANPEGTFTRQPVAAAVDLRSAATATADVTVN